MSLHRCTLAIDPGTDRELLRTVSNDDPEVLEAAPVEPGRSYAVPPLDLDAVPPEGAMDDGSWGGDRPSYVLPERPVLPGLMERRRVVIGPTDDRRPADASTLPYRAIALLICRSRSGIVQYGTGFFISPTCLITAGHCVFDHRLGGWMERIEVCPGGCNAPYGQVIARKFKSVEGWTVNRDDLYDHGAVILDNDDLFVAVGGRLGYRPCADDPARMIEVAGYPEDRAFRLNTARGTITRVTERLIYHDADTERGDSGAPLFHPGTSMVIGVHTYGDQPEQWNSAVRLRPSMAQVWQRWSLINTPTS
ncbi:MAG: trypsin-like serine protease [Bacteroidetes bacterium]|nr:trypsin-like serine protease [Bacteroidota bacterium]